MKPFQPTSTMLKIENYFKAGSNTATIARLLGMTEAQVVDMRHKFREGMERNSGKGEEA